MGFNSGFKGLKYGPLLSWTSCTWMLPGRCCTDVAVWIQTAMLWTAKCFAVTVEYLRHMLFRYLQIPYYNRWPIVRFPALCTTLILPFHIHHEL